MQSLPERAVNVTDLMSENLEIAIEKLIIWGFIAHLKPCFRCHDCMTLAFGNFLMMVYIIFVEITNVEESIQLNMKQFSEDQN